MGALCVANKKNMAVKDDQIAVQCVIIPPQGNQYSTYFKQMLTFKEIKFEIAKKIKKDRNFINLEIQGKEIKYENLQLSYLVKNKLDLIEIKVIENHVGGSVTPAKSNSKDKSQPVSNFNTNNLLEQNKEKEKDKESVSKNAYSNIKDKDIQKFNSNNSKLSKQNSILENSNLLDEQSVVFMSKICDFHNSKNKNDLNNLETIETKGNPESEKNREKERLTMICQTCGVGICGFCKEELHKDHIIVKKIDIVEFNKTLVENQNTLNTQLLEMRLDRENTAEIIKNYRIDLKKHSELFNRMIDEIKKKEQEIIENFKQKIDSHLPFILCYRDNLWRINKEYEKKLNLIISDDKMFMQYYLDYLLLSNQVVKSADNLSLLKLNLSKFNYISEDYQRRTELISNTVKEHYSKINKYMLDDNKNGMSNEYYGLRGDNINNYGGGAYNGYDDLISNNNNNMNINKSPRNKSSSNNNPGVVTGMNSVSPIKGGNNNNQKQPQAPQNRLSLKELLEFQSKNISVKSSYFYSSLGENKDKPESYIGGGFTGGDNASNNFNNNNNSNNINNAKNINLYESNYNAFNRNNFNSSQNNFDMINSYKQDPISLKTLVQTPHKTISGLMKKNKKRKTLLQSSEFNNKSEGGGAALGVGENLGIINEFNSTGKENSPDYIFNLEIGSNSVFMYKCNEGNITMQQCKFESNKISKFESHHSSLNYKNRFYVSGNGFGYGCVKSFMMLDIEDDFLMKELPHMPSSHSFHGMLGVFNSVLVISGTSSNKVELFNLISKNWVSLPDLHNARTWPSSIFVENIGVFVFGGLVDSVKSKDGEDDGGNKEENINRESFTLKIEKLDISTIKKLYEASNSINAIQNINKEELLDPNLWEILTIKFDQSYLPIYSGFVFIPNNESENNSSGNILIFGGKTSLDDYESEDKVLNLNLDTLYVKEENFFMETPDEFDGRLFVKFTKKTARIEGNEDNEEDENGKVCYAGFSSITPKRVHLFYENKMEIVECPLLTQSSYKVI